MSYIIRKCTKMDIEQVYELMKELAIFEEYIDQFHVTIEDILVKGFEKNPPEFHCFVAEKEQDIVGILVYYYIPFTPSNRPIAYLKELYIKQGHRGEGIGEALMFNLRSEAEKENCCQIKWTVAQWNESGKNFYAKLGAYENKEWLPYQIDL